MDAAQERLQALSHTQQALMDKIKALDELDQADDYGEQRHLQEANTAPQQPQDEEALLSMLLQKQAELQKMRAAIDELKTMDAGVTDAASRLRPEAPVFAPPRSQPAPAPSSILRPEAPAFAPPATKGGSAEPSEADLLAALKSKRDELLRMQQAIKQLEGMGPTGQEEEEVAEDIDYGEEDFEQDDDDDDGGEPGSQEEWLQKLMQQQRELLQLRSAIELAKRGSNQEEEEDEDEEDEEEDDDEYDDDEGQVEERDEDGPGVQGVLANLLAKKQELAELLTLKASLEKQLLQQEGDSDDDDKDD